MTIIYLQDKKGIVDKSGKIIVMDFLLSGFFPNFAILLFWPIKI